MKQKQNHGHRKQIDVCQGGEGGKGRSGRLGLPDANWYIQNVRTTRSHCIAQGAIFRPRGATPRPRSRAEAGRTPRPRGSSQEELSHFRSQGQQPKGVIPHPRSGAVAKSARLQRLRNGREGLPHVRGHGGRPGGATQVQGAVAVWVQEGLEELFHIQGQEGWW